MHAILIPMFNKLLLSHKQMTKYTLDIFESPFVTQQSNVRNILNIFKSNALYHYPMFFVEFEETAMLQSREFCFFFTLIPLFIAIRACMHLPRSEKFLVDNFLIEVTVA